MEMKEKHKTFEQIQKFRFFFLIAVTAWIMWMFPYVMDYYVLRSEPAFFDFYALASSGMILTYWLETIVLLLVTIAIVLISKSCAIAYVCVLLPCCVLTYASQLKYVNRSELLTISDLGLTEAAGMATRYLKIELNAYICTLVIFMLVAIGLGFGIDILFGKYKLRFSSVRKNVISAVIALVLAALSVCTFQAYMKYDNTRMVSATESISYRNNYVLYRFLNHNSLTYSDSSVQKSYENMLSGYSQLEESTSGETITPNVIVLMAESWWDTDNISSDAVTMSIDPMQPIKDHLDELVYGCVATNVYGGGTVSSEGEFFTGCSSKYYLSSVEFDSLIANNHVPTINNYFHSLNYETIAIHPYYGYFYDREKAYEEMAFDQVIFEQDMDYKNIYTKYISDDSLVNQVIHEYENRDQTKSQYIWAMSVGNHKHVIEYESEEVMDYDWPIDVTVSSAITDENQYELKNYLNGIYLTNFAYMKLVEHFKDVDEPTIIMMYGDHIPNFSPENLQLLGLAQDSNDVEEQKKVYSTPVVIWKNYESEATKPEISYDGINQLPRYLIEYGNMPQTEMTQMLRYESSVVHTNTRFLTLDSNGNAIATYTKEQQNVLRDTQLIEYDLLKGNHILESVWNPILE